MKKAIMKALDRLKPDDSLMRFDAVAETVRELEAALSETPSTPVQGSPEADDQAGGAPAANPIISSIRSLLGTDEFRAFMLQVKREFELDKQAMIEIIAENAQLKDALAAARGAAANG